MGVRVPEQIVAAGSISQTAIARIGGLGVLRQFDAGPDKFGCRVTRSDSVELGQTLPERSLPIVGERRGMGDWAHAANLWAVIAPKVVPRVDLGMKAAGSAARAQPPCMPPIRVIY